MKKYANTSDVVEIPLQMTESANIDLWPHLFRKVDLWDKIHYNFTDSSLQADQFDMQQDYV